MSKETFKTAQYLRLIALLKSQIDTLKKNILELSDTI